MTQQTTASTTLTTLPLTYGAKHHAKSTAREAILMRNRPWTPEEEAYLIRYYTRYGAKPIATKLERSISAIHTRANKLWLMFGEGAFMTPDQRKFMTISEIAAESGHRIDSVYRTARDTGVILRRNKYGVGKLYIDALWGQAYIKRAKERLHTKHNYTHYWTSKQAARFLGTNQRHLGNGLIRKRGRFRHYAHMARFVRGERGRLLFEPSSIRRIAIAMRDEMRQSA